MIDLEPYSNDNSSLLHLRDDNQFYSQKAYELAKQIMDQGLVTKPGSFINANTLRTAQRLLSDFPNSPVAELAARAIGNANQAFRDRKRD